MAAKAPANDHVLKLFQLSKRYDIDKLLDAAATCDWHVITNDEKRVIKRQSTNKLDRLMMLITENGREVQFANFILRYNSDIQDTAIAVTTTANNATIATYMRPKAESSASLVLCADQTDRAEKILYVQQPDDSRKSSTSSTGSPDSMDVDTTCTDSQEASSMDTGSKDNLLTQLDNLSSSSQESPDIGYHSGSSKDFQSQTQSTGHGGYSFQSSHDNLKVIQKNQRSRQRELKRSDISRHQQCHNYFHQPTVVVNHYHVSPKEEQQMLPQWPPPVREHCHDIIQCLNMEMLTPHLLQNDLLAPPEYQQLDALGTSWKQAKYFLLNVLPTKGGDGYKRFLKCLKEEKEHSGHQDLFRHLESS